MQTKDHQVEFAKIYYKLMLIVVLMLLQIIVIYYVLQELHVLIMMQPKNQGHFAYKHFLSQQMVLFH